MRIFFSHWPRIAKKIAPHITVHHRQERLLGSAVSQKRTSRFPNHFRCAITSSRFLVYHKENASFHDRILFRKSIFCKALWSAKRQLFGREKSVCEKEKNFKNVNFAAYLRSWVLLTYRLKSDLRDGRCRIVRYSENTVEDTAQYG